MQNHLVAADVIVQSRLPCHHTETKNTAEQLIADVSVIIPCYRCSKTIARAIASVHAQTLQVREVILIDDFSNDGTLDELFRLQKMYFDGWIKVIPLQVNCGPGTARNVGWEASSCTYIAFLDADDSWHHEKIRVQYNWMCLHTQVALTGHSIKQLSAENTDNFSELQLIGCNFLPLSSFMSLLSSPFMTPTVMIRRNVEQRFENLYFSEDRLTFLRIGFDNVLYKCDQPLAYIYKFCYGETGLSSNMWNMELGEINMYRKLYIEGKFNGCMYIFLLFWSMAKFIRRLFLVLIR